MTNYITEKIKKYLNEIGAKDIEIREKEDIEYCILKVEGRNHRFFCTLMWHPISDKYGYSFVLNQVQSDIKVPNEKKQKIFDFFGIINNIDDYSPFHIDLETGEITCSYKVWAMSDDVWDDRLFNPIFNVPVHKFDSLFPHIMQIIYSEKTPKEVAGQLNIHI